MFIVLLILSTLNQNFSADQKLMHKLQSEYRVSKGLPPQKLDPGLCRQAQRLAEAQNQAKKMFHSNWNWRENVAYGASPSGSVKMWINSSGHRANLLSKDECVGFGYSGLYAASLHGKAYIGPDLPIKRYFGKVRRRR